MIGAKRVKPTVERILREKPATRNSYHVLYKEVMASKGLYLTDEQIEIFLTRVPSFESVSRCARKIWEEGNYLPDDDVRAKRRETQEEYRHEMVKKYTFTGNTAYVE